MANSSILEQMLEAATKGGGLKGTGGQSGQGGLGDLLGQVLGGGQAGGQAGGLEEILGGILGGGAGGNGQQGAGGGLGDILGQVLGGAAGGGSQPGQAGQAGQAGGGGLGDILGQVLGGAAGGQQGRTGQSGGGGLGDILGQVLGGASGGQQGSGAAPSGSIGDILGSILGGAAGGRAASGGDSTGASDILKDFAGDKGATAAPSAPSFPTPSPSAPRSTPVPSGSSLPEAEPASGGLNDLVKYGGIAVLGMLAYKAMKNWQAGGAWGAPPSGKGFLPSNIPGGGEAFSGELVKAMIAATQADGMVDEDEQRRIVGGLSELGIGSEDRDQLARQMRQRIDPREIIAAAKTQEMALQLYLASVMAIKVDTPVERQYLDALAAGLKIDPGLKAQLENTIGRA